MEEQRIIDAINRPKDGDVTTQVWLIKNNLVLQEIRDFAYITMLFVCGGVVHYFFNNWIITIASVVCVAFLSWVAPYNRFRL